MAIRACSKWRRRSRLESAKNHPFLDGNKRTSLVATELLLELNGFDLAASDAEIVSVWRSLAESSVTEAELAEWLERHYSD